MICQRSEPRANDLPILETDGDQVLQAAKHTDNQQQRKDQLTAALANYNRSLAQRKKLAGTDDCHLKIALTHEKIGRAHMLRSAADPLEALRAYSDFGIADLRFRGRDKLIRTRQRDLEVAQKNMHRVKSVSIEKERKEDLNNAFEAFTDAAGIYEGLKKFDERARLLEELGDVQVTQGYLAKARENYDESWKLSGSPATEDKLVDVLLAESEPQKALVRYNNPDKALESHHPENHKPAPAISQRASALETRRRLADSEPDNPIVQRDLALSYEKIGDVHRARGAPPDARKYYDAASKSLAKAIQKLEEHISRTMQQGGSDHGLKETARDLFDFEAEKKEWRRNQAALHEKFGDALLDNGMELEALREYREGLNIKAGLKDDTTQRELAKSHERIGDVLYDQYKGDNKNRKRRGDALETWKLILQIYEKFVGKTDDLNKLLLLVEPLWRTGEIGEGDEASKKIDRAYDILSVAIEQGLVTEEYRRNWIALIPNSKTKTA
jgi:hypothetical protein